ncbi:NDP-sugar synthase [bacterium]|nr:NDP-sugar synthase [bacterium]
MLTKAMIMAAGVGSRLEPLSSVVPKPLVPLVNIPSMDILVNHLVKNGITDIIANTYHKADFIKEHYKEHDFGINIKFITEETLSGTAGGVKKCQSFFDRNQDFIVMSGDGLSDIDIEKAYSSHKKSGAIATIIVKEVEHKDVYMYGIIVPDEKGYVDSFQEKPSVNEAKSNLANTGIYIFNYRIFDYIPENTFYDFAKNVFPSIFAKQEKINTYIHKGYWTDIGSISQYKQSNKDIIDGKVSSIVPNVVCSTSGKYVYGENFKKSLNCKLIGNNVIGNNCELKDNCTVKNSVIWDNVTISEGVTIENSIVLPNITVNKSLSDEILSDKNQREKQPV